MRYSSLRAMQNDRPEQGQLRVFVLSSSRNIPVENAQIDISYKGDPEMREDQSLFYSEFLIYHHPRICQRTL